MVLYLSRFFFGKSPRGLALLSEPHALHGAVRAMAGGQGRYLYRLEVGGRPALLAQTPAHPDLTALPPGLEFAGVKRLSPEALRRGAPYRFLLRANLAWRTREGAVHIPSLTEAARGVEEALQGARLLRLEVRKRSPLKVRRPEGKPFSLDVVEARGILVVEEPEALFGVLARGIGRGKAYGLGLLSLAPLR